MKKYSIKNIEIKDEMLKNIKKAKKMEKQENIKYLKI